MKTLSHSKSDTNLITIDKKVSETLNTNLQSLKSNFLKKDYILPRSSLRKSNKKTSTRVEVHNEMIKSNLSY